MSDGARTYFENLPDEDDPDWRSELQSKLPSKKTVTCKSWAKIQVTGDGSPDDNLIQLVPGDSVTFYFEEDGTLAMATLLSPRSSRNWRSSTEWPSKPAKERWEVEMRHSKGTQTSEISVGKPLTVKCED